jgi:hypothetical protein
VACGGTKNETTINGNNAESLESSPAGVASLVFLDLESVRADALPAYAPLPGGDALGLVQGASVGGGCSTSNTVTSGTTVTTTITFGPTCTAANGNSLAGTVTVVYNLSNPLTAQDHSVTYDLTAKDATQTKVWTYKGTRLVSINQTARTAHISVPTGTTFTVSFTDTANTLNNKTYAYAPNLYFSWGGAQVTLWGGYSFTQGNSTITATMSANTPLIWAAGCCYPISGTISLATGSAQADAVFGPACGDLKLNGGKITLATCN